MNPTVESLRWQKFPVLDNGFVCLVDCMGDDSSIVQAARVSYGKDVREEDQGDVEKDRGLIRYLMRHRHTTPFEMAELKFLVRVPMDCWRQWIRHRTANVNEYSTRYTEAIDSQQKTDPAEWRLQSGTNKQGSSGFLPVEAPEIAGMSSGENLTAEEKYLHDESRRAYLHRLNAGVAKEQARKDLPLSTYTEAYWKIDLHNLFHFLGLRMDSHAQKEIRDYATIIGEQIVKLLFPVCWEAFEDYRLNGMFLSALDIETAKDFITGQAGDLSPEEIIPNKREREECIDKLKRLGAIS